MRRYKINLLSHCSGEAQQDSLTDYLPAETAEKTNVSLFRSRNRGTGDGLFELNWASSSFGRIAASVVALGVLASPPAEAASQALPISQLPAPASFASQSDNNIAQLSAGQDCKTVGSSVVTDSNMLFKQDLLAANSNEYHCNTRHTNEATVHTNSAWPNHTNSAGHSNAAWANHANSTDKGHSNIVYGDFVF